MLALRPSPGLRTSSFLGLCLLIGGCFDPDPTPLETESADPTVGATDGEACEPEETRACTCADGSGGTQACNADGSGFGACECEGADSTTTLDPTETDPTSPPECESASDCMQAKGVACQIDVCVDGMCMVENEADGTECDGAGKVTECTMGDVCLRGGCVPNVVADGTPCTECDAEVCSCMAGSCGVCEAFAPENNFVTTRSIAGWTLTGGWGLYREAPQSNIAGPTVFGGQVFGTDGNRSAPYPGVEVEASTARSGAFVLPATLEFLSWNLDEGGSSYDTKQVRVSTDGGASFVTLVDCATGQGVQPFCTPRNDARAPDDWDAISIPVPGDMVGEVGIVELSYNTNDSCCDYEKGWFIDVANFATECACAGDEACAGLGSECGAAVCGGSGECELDVVAAGTDCGEATEGECNAPDACDGAGYCATNEAANGLTQCASCPAGAGSCNACQLGECIDCLSQPPTNDFNLNAQSFAGWLIEDLGGSGADWQIFVDAPPSQEVGSMPTPLSFAPSFGTDGNRVAPYPGIEAEHSRITTTPDVVPPQITFSSWHVDEGTTDNKIIEISVDGGGTWATLVDCLGGAGAAQPFCQVRNDPRPGDQWDAIVIDTAPFAGQVGQLRFTYNTQDACCQFERGWFIDDLDFAQYCFDSPFPI